MQENVSNRIEVRMKHEKGNSLIKSNIPLTSVQLRSTTLREGITPIYETAVSSMEVLDNKIVSRQGTCPANIATPAELIFVLLRFKYLRFAPTLAMCSIESSTTKLPLRFKCVIAFIEGKKKNDGAEELDKSK